MTKQNTNSKKGFTIIEVVLVLAIAGLIFLMVFVAYPALRRNQADTARRNDFSRFISQLAAYKTNNRATPQSATEYTQFRDQYLDGANGFVDPDGESYVLNFVNRTSNKTAAPSLPSGVTMTAGTITHNLVIYNYAQCQGQTAIASPGKNDIAIVYAMENGLYCGSNAE